MKNFDMKLDKWLYESRPVSLFLIATYAIAFPSHQTTQIAGLVLLGCTIAIAKMRLRHRGYISF